jgi:hypothetical protein
MSTYAPTTTSSASSDEDEGNPFMTLVDTASSILDKAAADPAMECASTASEVSEPGESSTSEPVPQDANEASNKDASCPSSPGKKLSFAEQLMTVLDDESYSDGLVWMPDDKSFTIINPKKFTMVDMPKLFNIRNMSSFIRKLNRWGISRNFDKETQNSDIFKHKDFLQGDYKLCAQIKCTGRNPTSSRIPKRAPSSKRHVLTTAIESLRRERDAVLIANLDATFTAQAIALRRLLDQQQQLSRPSWLATSNAHPWGRGRPSFY